MSRRVHAASTAHMHRAWDSQPLVGPTPRARRYRGAIVLLAFVVGLLIGLCI